MVLSYQSILLVKLFFPYSSNFLFLNNVLVSNKIVKNLISVHRFCIDNLVSVEFDPFGFTVKDLHTGTKLHRSDSNHSYLYPVLLSPTQSTFPTALIDVSSDFWHRRFGHPGQSFLIFLAHENLLFVLVLALFCVMLVN